MTDSQTRVHSKLKSASLIVIAGLIVEGLTLYWAHPTSFILFSAVGALLVIVGIVAYLRAIVRQ